MVVRHTYDPEIRCRLFGVASERCCLRADGISYMKNPVVIRMEGHQSGQNTFVTQKTFSLIVIEKCES